MSSAFFTASASRPLIRARCFSARAARSAISRVTNPSSPVRRRIFGLLLLQPVEPFPDLCIRTGSLLNAVILGLLICKQGKRSLEILCLCSICVPFPFQGLLLLDKTDIRGLLLGEQFQVSVEFFAAGQVEIACLVCSSNHRMQPGY